MEQQAFVNLRRGRPGLVPPPLASAAAIDDYCTSAEKHMLDSTLACRAVGAPATGGPHPGSRLCSPHCSRTPNVRRAWRDAHWSR